MKGSHPSAIPRICMSLERLFCLLRMDVLLLQLDLHAPEHWQLLPHNCATLQAQQLKERPAQHIPAQCRAVQGCT